MRGCVQAPSAFRIRRLAMEASRLAAEDRVAEAGLVQHLVELLDLEDAAGRDEAVAGALLRWAGLLESAADLRGAASLLRSAALLHPEDPCLALHRARIERKRGRPGRAFLLYRSVQDRRPGQGRLPRMARIGQALVGPSPLRALGRCVAEAREAKDGEAGAVAREERARVRRRNGDTGGALRDYLSAARRYPESVDGVRVLHEAADLLSATGDPLGAREVLLTAVERGRPEQRAHAARRLHQLSRQLGDQVGRRRWRHADAAPLVSLLAPRRTSDAGSRAERVRSWVRRTEPPA